MCMQQWRGLGKHHVFQVCSQLLPSSTRVRRKVHLEQAAQPAAETACGRGTVSRRRGLRFASSPARALESGAAPQATFVRVAQRSPHNPSPSSGGRVAARRSPSRSRRRAKAAPVRLTLAPGSAACKRERACEGPGDPPAVTEEAAERSRPRRSGTAQARGGGTRLPAGATTAQHHPAAKRVLARSRLAAQPGCCEWDGRAEAPRRLRSPAPAPPGLAMPLATGRWLWSPRRPQETAQETPLFFLGSSSIYISSDSTINRYELT
ncbi:uncharacterized protein [Tiliqua scincoides]|uniref:uncharacterized protein n=1 Tax=Tiliqua scincoides TaxID=71010 RepID=UPI00346275B5